MPWGSTASVRQKGRLPAPHASVGSVRSTHLIEKTLVKYTQCNLRAPRAQFTLSNLTHGSLTAGTMSLVNTTVVTTGHFPGSGSPGPGVRAHRQTSPPARRSH